MDASTADSAPNPRSRSDNHRKCIQDARLSKLSTLKCVEVSAQKVESIRDAVFEKEARHAKEYAFNGFKPPIMEWYRSQASRPHDNRVIFWKKNAPFDTKHLFFRMLDSGCVYPIGPAVFRTQMYLENYLHERYTQKVKDAAECGNPIPNWEEMMLVTCMHELVILRNFVENGAGDIPFIYTNWDKEETIAFMEYIVGLSSGEWNKEQQEVNFCKLADRREGRGNRPCIYQSDCLVRALLSDPATEYVPPFIVIVHNQTEGDNSEIRQRATVLFSSPVIVPPSHVLSSFPQNCGTPGCTDESCYAFWDFTIHRVLHKNSKIVRKARWDKPEERLCNFYGCNVVAPLQRCAQCKTVGYCGQFHQKLDWYQHKLVCEK